MLKLVKNEEIKEVSVKDDEVEFIGGHWRVLEQYEITVDYYDGEFICWLVDGELTMKKPHKNHRDYSKWLERDLWYALWNDPHETESVCVDWSDGWKRHRVIEYSRGQYQGEIIVKKMTWVNRRKKK